MRAILIALALVFLAAPLSADGPELMRRERLIPVRYTAPSRQTTPTASQREAARRQAKQWLEKYAEDLPKGWKTVGWEFKGDYAGPMTDGATWQMYRLALNPPLSAPGGPCFELYFGVQDKGTSGKELVFPAENHSRSSPPPRPPAVVELPPRK